MRLLLSTLLIACTAFLSNAQGFDKVKLNRYLDTLSKYNKFMGSVSVTHKNEVIYTKAVGYANLEKGIKNKNESIYGIGSISKTFTSVMCLLAVEEGKFSLDDKLSKFYPQIKNAKKISISNLLNHRSGIYSFTDFENYLDLAVEKHTEKEMIDLISKKKSVFEPDSKASYSNSNFVILSYILQKLYEKDYNTLLQEKICSKIGLNSTYLRGARDTDLESKSYTYLGAWNKEIETDPSVPLGAGSIVSTPSEISLFLHALFTGELLNSASLEKMKTIEDGYGMGIFQYPFYDKKIYGHTGAIDGFRSASGHYNKDDYSFAITSNGLNYDINQISIAVLSAIYGMDYDIPSFKPQKEISIDLKRFEGKYTSKDIPLVITISVKNNHLLAQASGQPAFTLNYVENMLFQFKQAGLTMEFFPEESKMILIQNGQEFTYYKE